MHYPLILIESPHQGRASGYVLDSPEELYNHAGRCARGQRLADAEGAKWEALGLPEGEGVELTEDELLAVIGDDLSAVHIIESAEELADTVARCGEWHNGASVTAEAWRCGEYLGWIDAEVVDGDDGDDDEDSAQ